jgi:hypothetical protein
VAEVRDVDAVVTVEDEEGKLHSLGGPLARAIYVKAIANDG